MGYEIPNIIREIFIPFTDSDDGITGEDYKRKYGIDLKDIFDFTFSTSSDHKYAHLKLKGYYKLYIVYLPDTDGYDNGAIVQPVLRVRKTYDMDTDDGFVFNENLKQNTFSFKVTESGEISSVHVYDNN